MKPYSVFIVLLIFVFTDFVVAETTIRKYSQGSVVIEHSDFRESETTPSEIERLKKCGDCPGIDGYLPHRITKGMRVIVRGNILDIPISFTKDLYNLDVGIGYIQDAFKIVENRKGIRVELSGGDGSGAYRVTFDIDLKNMRVKRTLYGCENIPMEVLEGKMKRKGKQ